MTIPSIYVGNLYRVYYYRVWVKDGDYYYYYYYCYYSVDKSIYQSVVSLGRSRIVVIRLANLMLFVYICHLFTCLAFLRRMMLLVSTHIIHTHRIKLVTGITLTNLQKHKFLEKLGRHRSVSCHGSRTNSVNCMSIKCSHDSVEFNIILN